jgi:hypothetical protein
MKFLVVPLALMALTVAPECHAVGFLFDDIGEQVVVTAGGADLRTLFAPAPDTGLIPQAVPIGGGREISNYIPTSESVSFDASIPVLPTGTQVVPERAYTTLVEATGREPSDRIVISYTRMSKTYHVAIGSDPELPDVPPTLTGAALRRFGPAVNLQTIGDQGLPSGLYRENGAEFPQLVATVFQPSGRNLAQGVTALDVFEIRSDVEVPGPIIGSGLPGLLAVFGGLFLFRTKLLWRNYRLR